MYAHIVVMEGCSNLLGRASSSEMWRSFVLRVGKGRSLGAELQKNQYERRWHSVRRQDTTTWSC